MKYCDRQCGRKTGLEKMVEYPSTLSSQNTADLRDGLVTSLAEAPSSPCRSWKFCLASFSKLCLEI